MRAHWFPGYVFAVVMVGLLMHLSVLQPSILTLQFSFDTTSFKSVLTQWGPVGIARFRQHLPADYVGLIAYGMFGFLVARRSRLFAECSNTYRMIASLQLPVAAFADAGENVLHGWLTAGDQVTYPPSYYLLAGSLATLKWALILVFLIMAMVGTRRWLAMPREPQSFRKSNSSAPKRARSIDCRGAESALRPLSINRGAMKKSATFSSRPSAIPVFPWHE